ncbi:MAG: hypoxanthine phosphoribosyltransferase [Nitrospirae bacterium GWC2_57_13]|jgi:hypoxanthine phosphoribosyltransferase|nr:MAG: hypoxanthine phosphoribosyltransferase [Nitrospirae bacterium GWC1_57_7]OGW26551.1 MAG: hypoxanthine phosphoribosyltransferase [Nitrospirae bacterium GWC2_57_13]
MNDIQEVLLDEQSIASKVRELGERISHDYAGRDLMLVCILKGAITFTADLMRKIEIPATLDFIQPSSYGNAAVSSRKITLKKDIEADVAGRHVLLVDCIIDTGETMDFLMKRLRDRGPASMEGAVLLDKRSRRVVDVPVKYIGFEIPDRFVVGYGLDYAQKYRTLPYVAVVRT